MMRLERLRGPVMSLGRMRGPQVQIGHGREANSTARPQTDVRIGRILSVWGADGFARVRLYPLGRACAHRAAASQSVSGVDVNKKTIKN